MTGLSGEPCLAPLVCVTAIFPKWSTTITERARINDSQTRASHGCLPFLPTCSAMTSQVGLRDAIECCRHSRA